MRADEYSDDLASSLYKGTLLEELKAVEAADADVLLCFNHGVIRGKFEPNTGHVVVFDRIVDGKVRIIDASPRQPKWRLVEIDVLFDAIQQHGDVNSGGMWYFNRK